MPWFKVRHPSWLSVPWFPCCHGDAPWVDVSILQSTRLLSCQSDPWNIPYMWNLRLSVRAWLDFSNGCQPLTLTPDTLLWNHIPFPESCNLCLSEFPKSVFSLRAAIKLSQTPVKSQCSGPVSFQAILVCSSLQMCLSKAENLTPFICSITQELGDNKQNKTETYEIQPAMQGNLHAASQQVSRVTQLYPANIFHFHCCQIFLVSRSSKTS